MEAKYGPGGSASTAKKGGKANGKKGKKEEEHAAPDVSLTSHPDLLLQALPFYVGVRDQERR